MPCDPVLKLDLLKFVLLGPVNSARDPQEKDTNTLKTHKRTIQTYTLYIGIITHNPPVVWGKITLPTRGLKSVTQPT